MQLASRLRRYARPTCSPSSTFGAVAMRSFSIIAEPPTPIAIGATTILVETPHQLLVNKLCALLSRSELRDLVDVRALLGAGGDLLRALVDCPKQDAGFSPLTFGWAVRGLPIARLAGTLGWPQDDIVALDAFKDELVDRVVQATHP